MGSCLNVHFVGRRATIVASGLFSVAKRLNVGHIVRSMPSRPSIWIDVEPLVVVGRNPTHRSPTTTRTTTRFSEILAANLFLQTFGPLRRNFKEKVFFGSFVP